MNLLLFAPRPRPPEDHEVKGVDVALELEEEEPELTGTADVKVPELLMGVGC